MKTFLDRLKEYYKIDDFEFNELIKEPSFSSLPSSKRFSNIDKVVEFLKDSIKKNKKILIYGDYDCDGIMSISIIYNMFKKEGFPVGFYIPNREKDGYGLTINNINRFHALSYEVIICVDNGITLIDEINYLNSLGMESVILDHHHALNELPASKYILHPVVSGFGQINMSAGEVCFYLSREFLGYDDEYLCTLAMISTISDLMELKSYNRDLVKIGLKCLKENKYINIMRLLGEDKEIISENIGSFVAPKINAIGRIVNDEKIYGIVRYFATDDENKISARAEWIEEVNEERKLMTFEATNEDYSLFENQNAIIKILDINEGICGLIANKLVSEFNKPVIILTKASNDILKGSIRAKNGFDVNKFFSFSSEYLLSYGGHSMAGGLVLLQKDFDNFSKKFLEYSEHHKFICVEEDFININLNEITKENYYTLSLFGPFGQGNKNPLFKIDNFKTSEFQYSKDKKHIITKVTMNSNLVYFSYDEKINLSKNVSLLGHFSINNYKGYQSCQFIINSFENK